MRVGLSLLTLVPGISGGSETYARELCRALARVGSHRYEVLVPTRARARQSSRAYVSEPPEMPGTSVRSESPTRIRRS